MRIARKITLKRCFAFYFTVGVVFEQVVGMVCHAVDDHKVEVESPNDRRDLCVQRRRDRAV
jgi:hypothetical protein